VIGVHKEKRFDRPRPLVEGTGGQRLWNEPGVSKDYGSFQRGDASVRIIQLTGKFTF
jgi:hypothetical protein